METRVMKCTCKHESQDQIYGAGNRLHNKGAKTFTCTVCGNKKNA